MPPDACPFVIVTYVCQFHKQPAAAGSVLLAVLCLTAVLSFLVITTAVMSREHGEMQYARTSRTRARQLAEKGIAVAAHPLIKAGDPLLRSSVAGVEGYEARLSTEERKLNLNALLTPDKLPLLERVFMSWGLTLADAQDIAASFMDWTDADDLKRRPGSAEKVDYDLQGRSGLPLNRLFSNLSEVGLVARAGELDAVKPGWRDWFTLRGNGLLDVNTASAEVLSAVSGTTLETAEQVVSARNGPDRLPHTADDVPFRSLESVMSLLGGAAGARADLLPQLTLQGTTRHVESIGMAGDALCGIAVVLDTKEGAPRMIEWSEFPVKGERGP